MDVDVVRAPADARGHMRADGLASTLDGLRREGFAIGPAGIGAAGAVFAIVATAGTTNAGTLDDLEAAAQAAHDHGLWLHVDGAYGGAALCAPSVRDRFRGIERADSFVVDPHKWLFAPYDCAALLYRRPEIARHAHAQHAGYLDVLHDEGEWNPSDYAFHLTRRARGLPFWYSLATHGTDAYRDAVEASLQLARDVADEIERREELELIARPELSVVLFRRRGWTSAQSHAWSDRMLAEQRTFTVPTTIPRPDGGEPETVLRFCFTHPRTALADVTAVLDTLR
jgi:glutamate/tyrosine decarboxylase-like PLP-dependent enzyme